MQLNAYNYFMRMKLSKQQNSADTATVVALGDESVHKNVMSELDEL